MPPEHVVKAVKVPVTIPDGAPEGRAVAAVVHFDTPDLDSDVVLKSAWPAGVNVAIQPSHDWNSYAIGEGVTDQRGEWGTVNLDFFLDTSLGKDWYASTKRRGDRQQWSFGYRVLESEPGTVAGQPVQFLKSLQLFEASPVLAGAQPLSHTMAIKAAEPGLPFADELDAAHAAVTSLLGRSQSLADLRSKEGRTLSTANRNRLAGLAESMRSLLTDLDELLTATEPAKAAAALPEVARMLAEYQALKERYSLAVA